jgi:hypothetical protein
MHFLRLYSEYTMKVFIVSFRLPDEYGIYKMVVVAKNHDEAEEWAATAEPNYEIGSTDLIDPNKYEAATVVRTIRYID